MLRERESKHAGKDSTKVSFTCPVTLRRESRGGDRAETRDLSSQLREEPSEWTLWVLGPGVWGHTGLQGGQGQAR